MSHFCPPGKSLSLSPKLRIYIMFQPHVHLGIGTNHAPQLRLLHHKAAVRSSPNATTQLLFRYAIAVTMDESNTLNSGST